jgi:LuxR family quorum-sensing system transcriptional regulator CciR
VTQLADVNEFVLGLKRANTAGDIQELLGSITREMGFHSYALVQHVRNFSRDNEKFLAVSNFGESWIDYFLEHQLHMHEPIYAASRRTSVGFRFSQVPSLIRLNDHQRRTEEARRKEAITDGFCVPAHIPGEANGSCTFVVKDNNPLPVRNLPMAQLVGSFAYDAARRLLHSGIRFVGHPSAANDSARAAARATHAPGPRLTTRQIDCIILVARGKTDWEIARILGLHEQTVTQHLNEARRRCGVSRRSELPIHALYYGHVTFADVMRSPLL